MYCPNIWCDRRLSTFNCLLNDLHVKTCNTKIRYEKEHCPTEVYQEMGKCNCCNKDGKVYQNGVLVNCGYCHGTKILDKTTYPSCEIPETNDKLPF